MHRALIIPLLLCACAAPPPELESRISTAARGADYPTLIPLSPLYSTVQDLLPEDPGAIGRSLESRAADLRRRAAALRALEL
ncbi:hypothetical protein HKCCE2091_12530 [Rhodobacterales bacterium HKCCE2091]|nr:hypothetical protein [Rhodobacterales bacterium HKCCE2091]